MMNAKDIAVREGEENRRRIFDWSIANPCNNQTDCAKALGLHRKTVARHWVAIRSGWTPDTAHRFGRSPNRLSDDAGEV